MNVIQLEGDTFALTTDSKELAMVHLQLVSGSHNRLESQNG